MNSLFPAVSVVTCGYLRFTSARSQHSTSSIGVLPQANCYSDQTQHGRSSIPRRKESPSTVGGESASRALWSKLLTHSLTEKRLHWLCRTKKYRDNPEHELDHSWAQKQDNNVDETRTSVGMGVDVSA